MIQKCLSIRNLSTVSQNSIGIFELQFLCACVIISYKNYYLDQTIIKNISKKSAQSSAKVHRNYFYKYIYSEMLYPNMSFK